jgi:hypothetical protein
MEMHTAAGLPHSKALDLDDLSWHVMTAPSEGTADAVWYRAWVEVPKLIRGYDITALHEVMHLFGESDHGGGPVRAMLERGIRWSNPERVFPQLNFDSAQAFFSSVETRLDPEHSPVWNYKFVGVQKPELPPAPEGTLRSQPGTMSLIQSSIAVCSLRANCPSSQLAAR